MRRFNLITVLTMAFIALGVSQAAKSKDESLESAVKQSYNFQHYLKDENVKVTSKNGTVTLKGEVSDNFHRTLAQETAADVPGVTAVENKLEVKGEQPAENSDPWVQAKVKMALLFHRNVSSLTDVEVKDGVATLSGKANSEAEKALTEEYAKDVEGVRSVNNQMTVAGSAPKKETLGDKIDDASITAQVKATLLAHRSTSAVNTHVKTKGGVVNLTGTAQNGAEKDLVTKLVDDINGVKDVNNDMSVAD